MHSPKPINKSDGSKSQEPADPDEADNLYILSDFRPVSGFVRVGGKLQPKPVPANDDKLALSVLDWDDWSTKKVPARESLMNPIIKQKTLNEIFAERGTGKTWLALTIAIGAATGTDVLRWTVEKPFRVLYVDGEMAFEDLQARANALMDGLPKPQPGYLRLIASDLQEQGIPDLGAEDSVGREMINKALNLGTPEQTDLLFLDNISVLTGTPENSDEGWHKIQSWLRYLKRRGVSVVFLHHAGKGGKQRGTSKKTR